MLCDDRVHVFLGRVELLAEPLELLALLQPQLARRTAWRRSRSGRRGLEHHEEVALGRCLAAQRHDLEAKPLLPAVIVDDDIVLPHRRVALARALDREWQRRRQTVPRHPEHVQLRLARRGLEIRARPPPELHDIEIVVDEHATSEAHTAELQALAYP